LPNEAELNFENGAGWFPLQLLFILHSKLLKIREQEIPTLVKYISKRHCVNNNRDGSRDVEVVNALYM